METLIQSAPQQLNSKPALDIPLTNLSPQPSSIEKLRDVKRVESKQLTIEQYLKLIPALSEKSHRSEVEKLLKVSTKELVAAISALGIWLGQSAGASPTPLSKEEFTGETDTIAIPEGFSKEELGHDVRKAVASILHHRPDEALIRRFIIRTNNRAHMVLTFGLVSSVAAIAQLGRIAEIDGVAKSRDGSYIPELSRMLVASYDLLDVSRADAMTALVDIMMTSTIETIDFANLEHQIVKARWVNEAAFTRLEITLDEAKESGNSAPLALELSRLVSRIKANPNNWLLANISQLTEGHVMSICKQAGISIEDTSRQEESNVKSWIVDAGLSNELDQLISTGIQAYRCELDEVFKAALVLRREGNLDWDAELASALSSRTIASRQAD